MGNTLSSLAVKILAGAQDVLEQEFNLPKMIESDFMSTAAKKGDPISIADAPATQTASAITAAATPPALADSTINNRTYSLDKWYKCPAFYLTGQDKQKLTDSDSYVPQMVKEAARGLIYQASSDLFALYKGVYGYAGVAATNMFATNTDQCSDVDKILNDQLCPKGNRFLMISNATRAAALKLTAFNNAQIRGDQQTVLNGEIGHQFGLRILNDAQVPTHTAGTITTGAIAKAATVVAIGATSIVCTTAASTGAVALKAGDIVLFASDTQTYTVGADVTQASAATDFTLTISPPKKVALAGSEALTVKATHVVNLALDPSSIAWTLAFADDEDGAILTERYIHPKTGIPLTLKCYGGYHAQQWELSCLYGMALKDPRKACRSAS